MTAFQGVDSRGKQDGMYAGVMGYGTQEQYLGNGTQELWEMIAIDYWTMGAT